MRSDISKQPACATDLQLYSRADTEPWHSLGIRDCIHIRHTRAAAIASREELVHGKQNTGWAKKVRRQTRGHSSVKSRPFFFFFSLKFAERFFGKFEAEWLLKIPLHLAYAATLPCERSMLEHKRLTINYKVV